MSGPPGPSRSPYPFSPYQHIEKSPSNHSTNLGRASQPHAVVEAGLSRSTSSQAARSQSSSSQPRSQSRIRRSSTYRPSEAIDLTINKRDKGKGKQTEPIDLTLTDTDEEEEMNRAVSQGSSSGPIIMVDKNGVPISSRDKGKGKGRYKPEMVNGNSNKRSPSFHPGYSKSTPLNPHPQNGRSSSSQSLRTKSPYLSPNKPSTSRGLHRHEAIDIRFNSSASTSPVVHPKPLHPINDGNLSVNNTTDNARTSSKMSSSSSQPTTFPKRRLAKSTSSNSINLPSNQRSSSIIKSERAISSSPGKQKKMIAQPVMTRPGSTAEWEARIAERERQRPLNENTKAKSQEGSPSRIRTTTPMSRMNWEPMKMKRSISRESLALSSGSGSGSQNRVKNESPLKKTIPLPSVAESPPKPTIASSSQSKQTHPPAQSEATSTNAHIRPKTPTKPLTQQNLIKTTPQNFFVPRPNSEAGPSRPTHSPVKSKHFPPKHNEEELPYRPHIHLQPGTEQTRKPSRERPKPGAYTLPAIDADMNDWPRTESTHSAGGSKKRDDKEKKEKRRNITSSQKASSNKVPPNHTSTSKHAPIKPNTTPQNQQNGIISRTSSSTSSSLTPLSSPSSSPSSKNKRSDQKESSYKPSPVKSLSASPIKGRPFPRLFGDETPVSGVITPKKDNADSPKSEEKEKDQEKEKETDVDAETKVDIEDILADFADFDWAASDDEGSAKGSDEHTVEDGSNALKEEIPSNPALALSPSNPVHKSPTKQSSILQTKLPSSSQTRASPPTTPRSSQKRPHPSSSPTESRKRRNISERYDQFFEEQRAQEEKEKEEERERERQLEDGLKDLVGGGNGDEREEEDGGGDLDGFFDNIASSKPIVKSPIKPNMKSAILSRQQLRKAKIESEKAARRKAKLEAIERFAQAEKLEIQKLENKEFAKIVRGIKKNKDIDEFLKDRRSSGAYPTPDSGSDSPLSDLDDDEDGGSLDEMDVDLDHSFGLEGDLSLAQEEERNFNDLVDSLRRGGVGVDEGLIRDAKASIMVTPAEKEGLDWEGFWEVDPLRDQMKVIPFKIASEDPILQLICEMTQLPDPDLESLGNIVSSGVLSFVENGKRELANELFVNAISSSDPRWSAFARSRFIDLVQTKNYLQQEDVQTFLQSGIKLLCDLGARRSILSTLASKVEIDQVDNGKGVTTGREEACGMVCRILVTVNKSKGEKETGSIDATTDLQWIPILLLLSIDNTTSSALKRTINDTVQVLLIRLFSDADDVNRFVHTIARSIVTSSAIYTNAVKVAILDSLAQKSRECRLIYRWLAVEWLLPGTLIKVEQMDKTPSVPPIPYLLSSIGNLSIIIDPQTDDKTEPDWYEINHLITFLYGSVSDIDTLLEELGMDFGDTATTGAFGNKSIKDIMMECEIERVREGLRRIRDLISDQSNGTLKSTVKARLHQLYEIARLTLSLANKKRVRARRLGKGLKVGSKGQTRLDFSVKREKTDSQRDEGKVGGGGAVLEKKGLQDEVTRGVLVEKNDSNELREGGLGGVTMEKKDSNDSGSGSGKGEGEDVEMLLG
uniref:Uncharacterized protein n=1 Tax=Kwoniella bestiolae CBS 10118 TaxID=1296100 RepID=A0A1B9GG62_9TREE|nr:hypothetical protein I302_01534 [Kwoniella bestiolae CBS 10118]OCF30016.1 hypothetical protein I302_01534 [Kwoniella bestiolae CBS 10118]